MKYLICLTLCCNLLSSQAQNGHSAQSLQENVYVYYFDLFDADDIFHWKAIPQNFKTHNYKFCFKNTGQDTLIFNKITTGDGRLRYVRYGTSVIFPGEYLVVQAIHNRSDIKHRVGPFDRGLFMMASNRDSSLTFDHAFTGSYIKDSLLKDQPNVHLQDSLLPVERNDRNGYQFFEWHDKLKAVEWREKQRRGEVVKTSSNAKVPQQGSNRENLYFVHLNGAFASKRLNGRLKYKTGNGALGTDSLQEFAALRASKSFYRAKKRILIKEGETERYVQIHDWPDDYAVLNINGAPPELFNDAETCLEYLRNAKNATLVRVEIGEDGTLTYRSDIEVKCKGKWLKLETNEHKTYALFKSNNEPYRVRIRWKETDSTVWNYDWLNTNRSYLQRFVSIQSDEIASYSNYGVEGRKAIQHRYRVVVGQESSLFGKGSELRDTMNWVLRWYGIPGEVSGFNEVIIRERIDIERFNRAMNKHFGSIAICPMYKGKYGEQYYSGMLTVEFQPGTSLQEVKAALNAIHASTYHVEDTTLTEILPFRVHAKMRLNTVLDYSKYVEVLNTQKNIYAVYTRFSSDPTLD